MRAFVLKARGELGWVEKDEPVLRDAHGVLLRPLLVSPCTSDVHTIWQGSPKRTELTLGHECVAEVVKAGNEVRDFRVGETVAVSAITPDWSQPDVEENYAHAGHNFSGHLLGKSIDGAFQERFYLPYADRNLAHIPEGLTLEDALICVDVMQTGFTAAEEAEIRAGQTVAVMGIGAIGLAAILAARLRGARQIFAIGSRAENAALAESMGTPGCAVTVLDYRSAAAALPPTMHPLSNSTGAAFVNEILQRTNGRGADAVLVCGGSELALAQAADMVKYGTGIISNVMYFGADPELEAWQQEHQRVRLFRDGGENATLSIRDYAAVDAILLPKFSMGRGMAGKTLKFSLSRGGRAHLEQVMASVRAAGIQPGKLITRRYQGLDKIERAIYDMKDRKAIKIAVKVGERN